MDEKTITLPAYIVERLEENLELFEKNQELSKKTHPNSRHSKTFEDKTYEGKLLRVLWHSLYAHEIELKERIKARERILEHKKVEFEQKNNSCSHTS